MLVSVVIPSYNHASYLDEALDSVLLPELAVELEVVVVDDGSSDDSLAILERRREADGRVVLIAQENRGAHTALNRGIETARGETVFILNSDDAFHTERIPRIVARFEEDPEAAAVVSWIEIVDGAGKTLGIKEGWRNMPPWPRRRSGDSLGALDDPLLALLEANWIATTSNVAFRRRFFEDGLRFSDLRYTHDWDFFLAVGRHGLREIREPLVRYRVHGANTIREGREEARARGQMRFESLWSLARHAGKIVGENEDLRHRLWNSLPDFTPAALFSQLLALRGTGGRAPAAYDEVLVAGHPLRESMIEQLSARPGVV